VDRRAAARGSSAVIENCTFWQSIPGASPKTEADIWIDAQVGGDSTHPSHHRMPFADTTRSAGTRSS
jgi:hypothetical protein